MTADQYIRFIDLAFSFALALLVLPPACYIFIIGWNLRRDQLFSYLNDASLERYRLQFPWDSPQGVPIQLAFRQRFHRLYGRRHYLLPLFLLAVLSAIGAQNMARSVQAQLGIATSDLALEPIAMSALLGSFMWVIADGLDRIRCRDLAPANLYWSSLRLLISVPFGYAISATLAENLGVPAAFFLGAFPTKTLFTIARRLGNQQLKLGDPQSDIGLELTDLQCINRSGAERFQDAGIDTISELAWIDPVDITMRTNFEFNYVLDCMSQALLWLYVEDKEKSKKLYQLGLRGAQEVSWLMKNLKSISPDAPQSDEQKAALATLQRAAAIMDIPLQAIYTTFDAVHLDPYTELIWKIWH